MPNSPNPVFARTTLDRWVFARLDEVHNAALRWRDELSAAAGDPNTAQAVTVQNLRMPQVEAVIIRAITDLKALRSDQLPTDVDSARVGEDEWIAGTIADLELIWEKIRNSWQLDAASPAQAIATMQTCGRYLDEIVFICCQLRLTPKINDILDNVETGHVLDLGFVFGPELPNDPERRKRLILEVAQERQVLNSALVDVSSAVIYRLAPAGQRWKSYLPTPLLLLAMFGILATLPLAKRLYADWPIGPGEQGTLLSGYAVWIIGAFAHVLIEVLKQVRSPAEPAFAVMDDWPVWFQLKQQAIFMGALWISLGFVLIVFSAFISGRLDLLDWKTLLLAGYSSDSVTELFVQRFESTAATVKDAIAGSAAPKAAAAPPQATGA
jgi:hypothetical protein